MAVEGNIWKMAVSKEEDGGKEIKKFPAIEVDLVMV